MKAVVLRAPGDVAVDEAHDHSGVAWDLFDEVLGRRSVDGQGTPLTVTVHYGQDYDNAFWDGSTLASMVQSMAVTSQPPATASLVSGFGTLTRTSGLAVNLVAVIVMAALALTFAAAGLTGRRDLARPAVGAFLAGQCAFPGITDTLTRVLDAADAWTADPATVADVLAAQEWARARARELAHRSGVAR